MATDTKGYRRYRARGNGHENGTGLAELRALIAQKEAATAPPAPAAAPAAPRPRAPRTTAPRPTRRRRPWSLSGLSVGGWIWRGALALLLIVLAWAAIGYWVLSRAVGEANDRIAASAYGALATPDGGLLGTAQNTLIIGSDGRVGASGQALADTIMIMRTDPDAGRIKFLSIPRDFMVQIPGLGTSKINAALRYGGQAGIIREVRDLTGIPIHHLVVISFRGLPKVVDELGGVTVRNPTPLVNCPYPGGRTVSFPAGEITLDGARALEYSRVRKCDNDFARAARQQALVNALKAKVVSFSSLHKAPWRGATVTRALSTDLGTIDLVKVGWLMARHKERPGDRDVLAGDSTMIGQVSYVVGLPDQNERQIARFTSSR